MCEDPSRERLLFRLIEVVGNSLDLPQTMNDLDDRLHALIDFETIALWLPRDALLIPGYVNGEGAHDLCELEVPLSEGGGRCERLRSTLAVRLEGSGSLTAVLALYHRQAGAFHNRDREVLQTIAPKCAAALSNALRFERIERLASIDPESSLLNERALFLRLDAELARARRNHSPVGVLVCDFGGGPAPWQAIGTAAQQSCREEDFVARMGDAMVLVLGGMARMHLAEKQRRIASTLAQHGAIAAIGAAFYPEDGADAEDLLAIAGAAAVVSRPVEAK